MAILNSRRGSACIMSGAILTASQIVRVHTKRGWVVLASDASHYYENMETNRPFPTVFHLGDNIDGFRKVRAPRRDLLLIISSLATTRW